MGCARHLLFSLGACAVIATATLAAGCGSDSSGSGSTTAAQSTANAAPAGAATYSCRASTRRVSDLRSAGVVCHSADAVASAWAAKGGCELPADTSRGACTVSRFRCLATATDRGLAVSCSRPGHSVSFIARR